MGESSKLLTNRAAWINTSASILALGFTLWLHRESRIAPAAAVAEGLRHVDFGVYEAMAANYYSGPASLLLAIAALAMFRKWRGRKLLHWLSWLFVLAVPAFILVLDALYRVAA